MCAASDPLLGAETKLYRNATILFLEEVMLLQKAAKKMGEAPKAIQPRDLAGFTSTYEEDLEGWETSALCLVDIFVCGLLKNPALNGATDLFRRDVITPAARLRRIQNRGLRRSFASEFAPVAPLHRREPLHLPVGPAPAGAGPLSSIR